MANVVVEYASGAPQGVTQIMGLGEEQYLEPADQRVYRAAERVIWVSLVAQAVGLVWGNKTLSHVGLGGLLAAVAVRQMSR